MKLAKVFCLAAAVTVLLTGCGAEKTESTGVPANPIEKEGYKLIFSDEFDESKIDTKKWLPQYFPHSTTVASACQTTYRMEDGKLCLYIDENTKNFSESTEMKVSSIQTVEKNALHPNTANVTNVMPYESFACQYGYFEIRAKMPDCKGGGHVAWWMVGAQDDAREDGTMSSQDGEIDIVETPFEYPNLFSPKVHAWHDKDLSEYKSEKGLEGDFENSYHIYAMDWRPEGITFYADGKEICKTENSPQYRMGMFLGIYTDCVDFTGAANDVYPKEFYIDYVRVYQDEKGYPNGVTKDSTPVVLPKDLAKQYQSKMLGDAEIAQSQPNLLFGSKVLLDGAEFDQAGLCDGDYKYGYISPNTLELPDEFVFDWSGGSVSADTLRLACNSALGQAPTYVEILTKTAGSDWKSVADCNLKWITVAESFEYVDIPISASNIKGLKLLVKDANLEWQHYVISELKLFLERDKELDSAKKVTSVKDTNKWVLPTNIAYMAESITSTGKGTGIDDLANEDYIAGYVSEDNPALPQEIVFNYDELQKVSGVRLSGNCSLGQSPTLVEVSVKTGGKYKSVGTYSIAWQSKDFPNEYADLKFSTVTNVEAVKITVKRANLEWKHYAIQEIQIF